ncbi:hypothetical protein ACJIZ3_004087 [Penstemon smallii]|uniref:Cytochrome P450 n=1 Tax=Penstemon smallii TaxID=265156 RepID=A0ABD3S157_9LAMI
MYTKLSNTLSNAWSWWWQSNNPADDQARLVLTSAIALLTVLWFFLFFIRKSSTNKTPPLPPGPKGLPLLGNLLSLDPELHTYFSNLTQKYGPIYTLKLGQKIGIVITSPAIAKEVLKDQDTTFANRDVPVAGLEAAYGGSDIVWNPYGPEWRMLRKVCVREMLSNNTLDSVYALRRKELRETISYLYSRAGSPVNVGEQMFLTMMNVITSMLWGGTVKGVERAGLGAEFKQLVGEMTAFLGMPNISDFYPGLSRFDLQGIQKKMNGLAKRFDGIFENMIAQRLKINGEGNEIVTLLWYTWLLVKYQKSHKYPLPPGPRGLPIVGNLPFLDPELHSYFSHLAHTYGPILSLKLGTNTSIVITSPALAREILRENDITFANRDIPNVVTAMEYGGHDIVFTPYGSEWRMLRKVCVRDMIGQTTLDTFYFYRRQEVRGTIKYLYSLKGSKVNVGEQMFLNMMNVVTSMLWGGTVQGGERDGVGAEFRQVVAEITELLGKPNVSDFFPGIAWLDLQGIKKQMKGVIVKLEAIFDEIIGQRLKTGNFGLEATNTGSFPPGPRGLPILGYLPFLREDLHNQFTELAHKYGPIYKLWLGNKLCVVISSPSIIKEVVRDHDTIFSNRDKSVAATIATFNANDISWCPYGTEWRERRKLFVREMLSNAKLEASYNLRKDEVRKAIGQVYSKIGSCIEISELAFMIDINLMMSMCWGSSIEGEGRHNIAKALLPVVAKIMDVLGKPNVSDYFPILARFDIQGIEKEMRGLMKRVECIIKGIIDDRIKVYKDKGEGAIVKEGRMDFLQMLVELNEMEDVKVSLTKTQMIAMFVIGPSRPG